MSSRRAIFAFLWLQVSRRRRRQQTVPESPSDNNSAHSHAYFNETNCEWQTIIVQRTVRLCGSRTRLASALRVFNCVNLEPMRETFHTLWPLTCLRSQATAKTAAYLFAQYKYIYSQRRFWVARGPRPLWELWPPVPCLIKLVAR